MKASILYKFGRIFTLPWRVARSVEAVAQSLETLSSRVSVLDDQLRQSQAELKREVAVGLIKIDSFEVALAEQVRQAQAGETELKQDVVARLAKFEAHNVATTEQLEELSAELGIIRQPEAVRPAQNLIALLLKHKKPLPDDIHEHGLRLELRDRPFDPQLTYSLVALLHNLGRPPMPDAKILPLAGMPRPDRLDADTLWRSADERARADDTIGVYAALWQAVLRDPQSARGWAEFARAFAQRGEWAHCRDALQRAFESSIPSDQSSADAALYALDELASRQQLGKLDWKAWIESLPAPLQQSPHMLALLLAADDLAKATQLLPKVMQRHGQNAETWLAAGNLAFQEGRVSESYDCLRHALDLDLPGILHHVMRNLSAQVSNALYATDKADDLASFISERTVAYEDLNLLPPTPAPESLVSARRIRRLAIDRGLPSAFLITQGKSASVSVGNILASGFHLAPVMHSIFNFRVISPWAKDFTKGGGIYVTHLMAFKQNVDALVESGASNIIVMVRDPRQALISYLEHVRKYWQECAPNEREIFSGEDERAIDYLIETRLHLSIDWIDHWIEAGKRLPVNFTTFESFVQDRDAFVDRLLALYGGDTKFFDRNAAFGEIEGTDYHRRLGSTDEWRGIFNARQTERANSMMPAHFWDRFNWTP